MFYLIFKAAESFYFLQITQAHFQTFLKANFVGYFDFSARDPQVKKVYFSLANFS